jgi:tRNA1Val (adenine37-N6)-methyltransferase
MGVFKFASFSIQQNDFVFKVGTDSMILGALIESNSPKNILDIGCGAGILSLFCATKYPTARITSIDLNEAAVSLTELNFVNNGIANVVEFICEDFNRYETMDKFDLIISNPPYFVNSTKSEKSHLEIARHQDSLSIETLLERAEKYLSATGELMLILPFEFDAIVMSLTKQIHLHCNRKIEINSLPNQPWRITYVFSRNITPFTPIELTVRNPDGTYHDSYKLLCAKYHDREI